MTWLRLLIAIASGLALNLAYPPFSWGHAVWWSLLPMLALLWLPKGKPSFKRGFFETYLGGFAFFAVNFSWIRHSSRVIQGASDLTWMGWPSEMMGWGAVLGLSLYLALYWGLFGGIVAKLGAPKFEQFENLERRARYWAASIHSISKCFAVAATWVGTEWLRGWMFTGFGWNGLGVAMAPHLSLIQVAEWVGVTGLSFLPVFLSTIFISTLMRFRWDFGKRQLRPYADLLVSLLLLLGLASFGARKMVQEMVFAKSTSTPRVSVLLVQPNLGQQEKWSPEFATVIYQDLARLTHPSAQGARYDLVVWPESALPYDFNDPNHIDFLNDALSWGTYSLLTGCDISIPGEPSYTGAALMFQNYENHQLYRKVHLVPFGEYLPLRSISLVDKLLGDVLPGDFSPGATTKAFTLKNRPEIQIVPLICFEDSVGRLARRFTSSFKEGTSQLLVNLTNDGWFLQSHQNEVHLTNALFRCIELRRPMARACNTGITCFIDATGQIKSTERLGDFSTGSPFVQGVLSGQIPLTHAGELTFYSRYGDVFSLSMLALSFALWIFSGISQKRNKEA